MRNPLLTDISIDWDGLPVADVYPKRIPDLFSAKPVVLTGRYDGSGRGVIRLKGKMAGRDFVREIPVDLPATEPQHDVLATLWARTRIDDLMSQDYDGVAAGHDAATDVQRGDHAARARLSADDAVHFVRRGRRDDRHRRRQPRRIDVPVEMPEGVTIGGETEADQSSTVVGPANNPTQRSVNSLFYLTPSASPAPGSSSSSNPTVSGGSATDNLYVVDGLNTSSVSSGKSKDPAKEVKQNGGTAGAGEGGGVGTGKGSNTGGGDRETPAKVEPQYGQSTGGIVNIVTKSGGNETTDVAQIDLVESVVA